MVPRSKRTLGLLRTCLIVACLLTKTSAVCDGNPHDWGRLRRCDEYDSECPNVTWQSPEPCEGIGGISTSDGTNSFVPTSCEVLKTPEEFLKENRSIPTPPVWPKIFTNNRFFEEQIFVRRDPFCLAQVPSMVSNGTHCFKRQEGTFRYDAVRGVLRIDYLQAATVVLPGVNMTEHFYHIGTSVHPSITRYGITPQAICPCIDLGIGPVSNEWAKGARFVGRERLGIEFLWKTRAVDHFVKGPHHVWTDLETGHVVRMYQPFNGLEVFDPDSYVTGPDAVSSDTFDLPLQCKIDEKVGCINGTSSTETLTRAFAFTRSSSTNALILRSPF